LLELGVERIDIVDPQIGVDRLPLVGPVGTAASGFD
jgi:hypothetical protein